ncbi:post-transcriptional regulator [Paenibacillus medicaginis]|uniref:Post-transcriptional regulator n=1 Tax=Paenibacillus medicaginis TaxID=1470560 RepID=A0ABV5C3S6_9BACL
MGMEELDEHYLEEAVEMLCRSKAEELRMVGYEYVTSKDVWDCVSSKYEQEGIPPLHKLVNDILSLKATSFMNFLTMSALRGSTFE